MQLTRALKPAGRRGRAVLSHRVRKPATRRGEGGGGGSMDRLITVSAAGYATARARPGHHLGRRRLRGRNREGSPRRQLRADAEGHRRPQRAASTPRTFKTSNFTIEPRYDASKSTMPVINGYRVSNQVEILVRDLEISRRPAR